MGFGTMNGPDGRPFKTRDGGTVKLVDLLDEAENGLYAGAGKEPAAGRRRTTHHRPLGGHRRSEIRRPVEEPQQRLHLQFRTDAQLRRQHRPYLLYAYTRVASVFRKAGLEMAR